MAITEVGGGTQRATVRGNNADSATGVYPANVTAGNLLICLGTSWQTGTGNTSISVSGTSSGTWTVLLGAGVSGAGGVAREFVAYRIAPSSAGDTVTVDPSGTGNYINGVVDEFTGASLTLDVDGGESTGNSTTPSDVVVTLTDGALVLGVFCALGLASSIAPGGGYTALDEDETLARVLYAAEFKIAGTAGSQTVDWTLGSGQAWAAYTAAFAESSGPGAAFVPFTRDRLLAQVLAQ